jgi:tetratricopeptide (TPR) repeat protein
LARAALTRALALNDRLVEANVALGFMRWSFEWDWEGAEKALQRALSLDPNDSDALGQYSSYLILRTHFEEALELTRRIERLEPFWIGPKVYKGVWQFFARRYDVALDWLRQAQEMEPRLFVAPFFLGEAYRFMGRLDEAGTAYQRALALMGREPLILGRLGALYAAQGRLEAARRIVEELQALSKTRYVRPTLIADIYLALGEHNTMFEWLARAHEERDTTLALLKVHPTYDSVRSDPRFRRLLAAVGLGE